MCIKHKHKPALVQSSKDAALTLNHTATSPLFPQTSLGNTQPWSFSIWFLPVESPKAGFPNH